MAIDTLKDPVDLSPEQLAQLIGRLKDGKRSREGAATATTIPRLARDGRPLPLSFAQEQLWFLDRLEPGRLAYSLAAAFRVHGRLRVPVLARALGEIARRHEVLRTRFAESNGRLRQEVRPAEPLPVAVVDLEALADGSRTALSLAAVIARWPFDLAADRLLRAASLRLSAGEHLLVVTMHHAVSDDWSTGILVRELSALYRAYSQGRPSPLPEPTLQYADFAAWQRQQEASGELAPHLDYWCQRLAGELPVIELPVDRHRPQRQSFRGEVLACDLPAEVSAALKEHGRRQGATLFMLMMSAFSTLLSRLCGQSEVLVGAPMASRKPTETEALIGMFVNTLVMRVSTAGGPSFSELVGRVKEAALEAFAHGEVPFALLVKTLAPQRELSRNPLVQVCFVLQNAPASEVELPDLVLTPEPVHTGGAQFDLTLHLREGETGVAGWFEYSTDLFDPTTIQRLALCFERLVTAVAAAPESRIDELPLWSSAERHQLLVDWNDTAAELEEATLHGLFVAQSDRTPQAPALIGAEDVWTYRRLADRSAELARQLRAAGVGPEASVGIFLDRTPEMVAALLAVLRAGGAYLPLDPDYPSERVAFTLADSGARLVLTTRRLARRLPSPLPARVLAVEELGGTDSAGGLAESSEARAGNLAYLIYTSGSTGKPKGVAIEHRSAVALLAWSRERFDDAELAGLLAATSICFDLSVFELFLPLTRGGTVVLAKDALGLAELEAASRVTLVNTVPSAMRELVRLDAVPSSVRTVALAGEPLPGDLVEQLYELDHVGRVYNLYGPSEDTTYSTWALAERRGAPPIGRPVTATRAHVCDAALRPVPLGVVGELSLGGAGLARGYLRRPAVTAKQFVPDPFAAEPGARLYRTGDRARWRRDGALDFLGRLDHQVKVRGYRIELGEVESALSVHSELLECAVVVREGAAGGQLVAYTVASEDSEPTPETLRAFLRWSLPEFMVPTAFVALDELPRTPNGKLDRRALPAPEAGRPAEFVAPQGAFEEAVARIWCEVLDREQVGAHDSFFDLGGHSLLATRVIAGLRDVFDLEIPLHELFTASTVAALAERVTARMAAGERVEGPAVEPIARDGELPLSYAQERLWFLQQLEPESAAYHVPAAFTVIGRLDPAALSAALGEVVRRHEALRTTFSTHSGQPVQRIAEAAPVELPVIDLAGLGDSESSYRLRRLMLRETVRPFDLERGPLLRARLIRRAPERHALLLVLHHIVSDGWSMGVLAREICALYAAASAGDLSPLAPLPVQYPDYAVWQRRWLSGDALSHQLDYWRRRLDGVATLELPSDRPRRAVPSRRGATRTSRLPASRLASLHELGRDHGATLFMVLAAVFETLLHRYSGQRDLSLGFPVAQRQRREIEGLIGFFVNTLVLRTRLTGDPTVGQLLRSVRSGTLEAFAHQDLPFEMLVDELQPERLLGHTPFFQAMLVLQNAPHEALALPGLSFARQELASPTAKFDLTLSLTEEGDGLDGALEYSTELFDATTAGRLLDHFAALSAAAAADPSRRLSELEMLSPAQRSQLLAEWNDTRSDYPRGDCLHQLFEARAASSPEAVAVVFERPGEPAQAITYGQLESRSNRLARHLVDLGVGPEVTVGVCLERGPEVPVALLAILKAGGAYVALDPAYPARRLELILADTGSPVLLTREKLLETLPGLAHKVCLDRDWPLVEGGSDAPLEDRGRPGSLAYVIYTSGSTGRPKGVAIEHHSAVVLMHWARRTFGDDLRDVLASTSINFDLSVFELLAPLAWGGRVILARTALDLPELGSARSVRLVNTVPSAITALVRAGGVPAGVRTVNLAGEPLRRELVEAIYRGSAVEQVWNLYGPSEDTTYSTWSRVARGAVGEPTIGRPLPDTQAYAVSSRLRPVPPGAVGELALGGRGLARGYLERPARTAESFVPDPFGGRAGARLYRTGDLARSRADGELIFLGRRDHQVKIRGFRIELGEVETALREHESVSDVALLTRGAGDDVELVACLVADPATANEELRAFLGRRLPEYMVPALFRRLDALPQTPNGKIDRAALAREVSDARAEGAPSASWVAPRSGLEEAVAAVWCEVLDRDRVGVHDDFFALGGHSLRVTRVAARLSQLFGVAAPVSDVFAARTVAQQAAWVEESLGQGGSAWPAITAVARDGDGFPLSVAQERFWFLEQLEPGTTKNVLDGALHLRGELDADALERALAAVVERHETLRTTFELRDRQPVQRIAPAGAARLERIDLGDLRSEEGLAECRRVLRAEQGRPLDLAAGPLFTVHLLRLAAEHHVLFARIHHIVADGWSVGVFLRELAAAYGALRGGKAPSLSPLPVQYLDYALWQRERLAETDLEAQAAYWRGQLADAPPALDLPTRVPRASVATARAGQRRQRLPSELTGQIQELARAEGATLFMVLLAGLAVLLSRISGQRDLCIGTPIAGRRQHETEGMIGLFLNTLALRLDLSGSPSFRQLLEQAREVSLAAYAHQDLPFERVLEELQPERDLSRTPFFQILLNLLDFDHEDVRFADLEAERWPQPVPWSKFDLTLYVASRGAGLDLEWVYNADLFDAAQIGHLQEQLAVVLRRAVTACDDPVDRRSLLGEAARAVLPDPSAPLPARWGVPVHASFAARAAERPAATALVDAAGTWTYGELDERSGRVAAWLASCGISRGETVAIYAHRSAPLAQAVLGVLKAGAVFVILDPEHPRRRLASCLEQTRPSAWIAIAAAGEPPALDGWEAKNALTLDAAGGGVPESSLVARVAAPAPDELAYVAFTSGTTGQPKGVLGSHRPLSHFVDWHTKTFELSREDRFSLLSGLAHDPLLRDLFTPLSLGATLCIPSPEVLAAPARLSAWMASEEITVCHLTPAYAQILASSPGDAEPSLPRLRWAFFGGDALGEREVSALRELSPSVRCVNFYGTTETPQAMGYFEVPAAGVPAASRIPVGEGIEGVQLLVRNAAGELAAVGEVGEIHVRTPYLTLGYLDDDELTRQRFSGTVPHERVYRTGDLGRFLPDGRVQLVGRGDGQIQLRGMRIEPAEIERALLRHPAVRQAAVVAHATDSADLLLVAHVVPEAAMPSGSELRDHLREWVPAAMIPGAFSQLAELPLTVNGKVDRAALRRRPLPRATEGDRVAPRTATERALAEIWARVLGVATVGVEDSFFELGGHSLLATLLVAEIGEELGVEVSLKALFAAPTIAALGRRVEALRAEGEDHASALPALSPDPANRHLPFPLTEIQQAYWIGRRGALELGDVASHRYLELESPDLDLERLTAAWRRLIDRHDMLRAVMLPDGTQKILPAEEIEPYVIEIEDLRGLSQSEADERLAAQRQRMSHQVLDCESWPLFEVRAARLGEAGSRRALVAVSFDYLIADAWSFRLLGQELVALMRDPAAAFEPLEISFRDYVLAQEALQAGAAYQSALAYWRERAATLPGGPELPLARPPEAIRQPRFARRSGRLPEEGWQRLQATARELGLTRSGVLLAAFGEVLAAWSKSPRFTLVLTLFQRLPLHPQVARILGDFTTTTLLAIDAAPNGSFSARARRLQERLWSDLDHSLVSGVRVRRSLLGGAGGSRATTTPVVFTSTLDLGGGDDGEATGETLGEAKYGVSQTPQVWLDHQVSEVAGDLVYTWDAVEELFPEGLLDAMFAAYSQLLERLAEAPERWQCSGRMVRVGEPEGGTQLAVAPRFGRIHDGFSDQARRQPEEPSVIDSGRSLSYGEMDALSGELARSLVTFGARPERLVAVVAEKGWEQLVGALAVVRSGAAYLPIDPSLPTERLHHLLERGRVELAVTSARLAETLPWPAEVRPVAVPETASGVALEPLSEVGQSQLAYVIFTSGSTGLPKGVMIEHRAAHNTLEDVNRRFAVGSRDRVLALSSLSFDLSVYDLFGLWAAGGAAVLPEPSASRSPERWLELLEREQVTIWNSVPALLEMLVEYVEGRGGRLPDCLRLVMLSGDWIPVSLPDRLRALASPDLRVVSLGGATEGSIWSILYPIDEVDPEWKSIPYGRAMDAQQLTVLDDSLAPRSTWVPGDLYIGGVGVARGYWRDPQRTAAAYVPHPETGERLYRTGDQGRYLPDGTIEFLGRDDLQVKIQGYRVELGEVEAALTSHPRVQAGVVTVHGEAGGARSLVAYAVATPSPEPREPAALGPMDKLRFKLSQPGVRRSTVAAQSVALARPEITEAALVEQYLERRSRRAFTAEPFPLAALGRLLASLAQLPVEGFPLPKYRYGSAGSLYPVQCYAVVKPGRVDGLSGGLYYYHPGEHRLVVLDPSVELAADAVGPVNRQLFESSAFALLLVAKTSAIRPIYGDRAHHYAVIEAGAMTQLLESEAPAQGLGLCQVGQLDAAALSASLSLATDDELVHSLLGGAIDQDTAPLEGFLAENADFISALATVQAAPAPAVPAAAAETPVGDLASGLRDHLESKLPAYMVPSYVILLERLPLTANGKVDRRALPAPSTSPAAQSAEPVAPRGETEALIAAAWREILGLEDVGRDDSFFEVGGTSVTLVRVYNLLTRRLEKEFPLLAMFEHPTVASLAAHLGEQQSQKASVERGLDRGARRRAARGRRPRP